MRPAQRPEAVDENDRLWHTLLVTGAVAGFALLGWQMSDYVLDAARPALRANDLKSALASVAMLAIVGVIAARRSQVRRASVSARPAPAAKRTTQKRNAAPVRRKRRA